MEKQRLEESLLSPCSDFHSDLANSLCCRQNLSDTSCWFSTAELLHIFYFHTCMFMLVTFVFLLSVEHIGSQTVEVDFHSIVFIA